MQDVLSMSDSCPVTCGLDVKWCNKATPLTTTKDHRGNAKLENVHGRVPCAMHGRDKTMHCVGLRLAVHCITLQQ
jgi:hypothetical protein